MNISLETVLKSNDYVELTEGEFWLIDLKYATEDNFVGKNVYADFNRAFLHKVAAEKLKMASAYLKNSNPDFRFIIYDALRPRAIQHVLWNRVVGTDQEQYVANPFKGSMHNYGFAIDLSVIDGSGVVLDMGSGFDEFSPVSQPKLEEENLEKGLLNPRHISNRKLLRSAMEKAGFIQLPHEWWHFDALAREEVVKNYKILE